MRKREKEKTGREIKSEDTCGCSFWKGRKEWKKRCVVEGGERGERTRAKKNGLNNSC